jgi:hypothetical protein
MAAVLCAACPSSNNNEAGQEDALWGEAPTSTYSCREATDGDWYSLSSAKLWAPQLLPMRSTVVVVHKEATFVPVPIGDARWSGDLPIESQLRIVQLPDLHVQISSADGYYYGSYTRKPVTIMPSREAAFRTIVQILQYSSLAYMQISWCADSRLMVAAKAWLSTSLWLPELSSTSEFYFAANNGEHDLVLLGPNLRQECEVPVLDFGPCEVLTKRSQLTRVLVCGYNTWGEALHDMEDNMSRVTEIVVSEYCPGDRRQNPFRPADAAGK